MQQQVGVGILDTVPLQNRGGGGRKYPTEAAHERGVGVPHLPLSGRAAQLFDAFDHVQHAIQMRLR